MTDITMRLDLLRGEMMKNDIDHYMIPSSDFHDSEYVGDYFKEREYMSGFNGSAGTLIVSIDSARLWTDGRYFLQAADQLEGSGIILMKQGEPGVPDIDEYLAQTMRFGETLGYDGRTVTVAYGEQLQKKLSPKGVHFRTDMDLVDNFWTDRPALPSNPIWVLEEKYAGHGVEYKLQALRDAYHKAGAEGAVLSALDDIAWLYNFRGNDVAYTPVALAYTLVTDQEAVVYISKDAVSPEVKAYYDSIGVRFRPYQSVYGEVSRIDVPLLVDPVKISETLMAAVQKPVRGADPVRLAKAIKTPEEAANFRQAHLKDGVALTKTIYYIKQLTAIGKIHEKTELDIEHFLTDMRKDQKNFLELSFESIIATGAHGAIVHYEPTPETDRPIEDGFLLMDTGGHYLEGTTDVTRTLSIGETTEEMRECYTAVLRGHLDLMSAVFPEGTSGPQLDTLARRPLWEIGHDYNHGTGHGVGYVMCVHEGPQTIRKKDLEPGVSVALRPGMITSNEPGVYLTGKFGVRIENLVLTVNCEAPGMDGFLGFETLTVAPYDRESIIPERLTDAELRTLNDYHESVYQKLSPYLTEDEADWLRQETAPIER